MIRVLISFTLFCSTQSFATPKNQAFPPLEPLPRNLEVEWALSALYQPLQAEAGVVVLNPELGYETHRESINGFVCLVTRTDSTKRDLLVYRSDLAYPICFDEEAARKIKPILTDVAKLRARGTSRPEANKIIEERRRSGYYKPLDRTGIAPMLSPVLVAYDLEMNVVPGFFPHHMFSNLGASSEDIGNGRLDFRFPAVVDDSKHGFIVLGAGLEQQLEILRDNLPLIEKICAYRQDWCLDVEAVLERLTPAVNLSVEILKEIENR